MYDSVFLQRVRAFIEKNIDQYFRGEHNKHVRYFGLAVLGAFIILIIGYFAIFTAPRDFPSGTLVSIEKGMTLGEISTRFEERSVIHSPVLFSALVRMIAGDGGALAGDYYFPIPESVWGAAVRITRGEYGLDPVRVVIPEGATIVEISEVLDWKLPSFPARTFLKLTEGKEGFLFPDTYFFLPNVEPKQVIEVMKDNFDSRIADLSEEIVFSGKNIEEIITMASILEKEALTYEDKEIISGILWKRISIGMPLQVDAPFVYGIGKNTFDLTKTDLITDTPYNTYTNKGLPPGPIANPGLDSIVAALRPVETPYFFYLSDRKGNMHYGRDFEEHKRNRVRFLN